MIFIECDLDKFVVRKIVPGKRKLIRHGGGKTVFGKRELIKHGGGKTGVLDGLKRKGRAVGIVDADPHSKPPGEMKNYVRKDARDTIKLLRKEDDDSKSLIELSPDIEGWMINRAKANGISLRKYGLPDDRKEMHNILHIERDLDFRKFIKRLLQMPDDEVNALRTWIKEAIE